MIVLFGGGPVREEYETWVFDRRENIRAEVL